MAKFGAVVDMGVLSVKDHCALGRSAVLETNESPGVGNGIASFVGRNERRS